MATARINALEVLRAAERKIASIEVDRSEVRAKRIAEIQREPVIGGCLWWKTIKVRSVREATECFDRWIDIYGTKEWWGDVKLSAPLDSARKLRRLANAALESGYSYIGLAAGAGDGFVTLDGDEVRFLDLPVAA